MNKHSKTQSLNELFLYQKVKGHLCCLTLQKKQVALISLSLLTVNFTQKLPTLVFCSRCGDKTPRT